MTYSEADSYSTDAYTLYTYKMLSGTNSLRNTHRSTFLRKLPGGVRQLVAVWVSAKHPPRQTEWTPFEKLSSTGRDKISTGTPNNFEQFYLETYSHGHKGGIINDEEVRQKRRITLYELHSLFAIYTLFYFSEVKL